MSFDYLRRREFITLFGSAAAAWPVTARAQQRALPVIGFLNATEFDYRVVAFRQGLKDTGYIEDYNVIVDYRWAEGQYDRLPAMAADLVRHKVAVLVAGGGAAVALVAKAATETIPIVFTMGGDPVASGAVSSLSRPAGNVTGVGFQVVSLRAKQVEMLHEAVPNAKVIGFLANPATDPTTESADRELQAALDAFGTSLVFAKAGTDSEFEGAFASLVQSRVEGLLVSPNGFFTSRRQHIVALAAAHSIPAIYSFREYPSAGGLMSYGTSIAEAYRLAGTYAGRILKGEKPTDLPVQLSTKIELIINLKTAKALGITVPITLLGRADEVIE
jgi:putative tryptophan/tyrosine transport system substrate-binding protein